MLTFSHLIRFCEGKKPFGRMDIRVPIPGTFVCNIGNMLKVCKRAQNTNPIFLWHSTFYTLKPQLIADSNKWALPIWPLLWTYIFKGCRCYQPNTSNKPPYTCNRHPIGPSWLDINSKGGSHLIK